jgi:hypothetical protein
MKKQDGMTEGRKERVVRQHGDEDIKGKFESKISRN